MGKRLRQQRHGRGTPQWMNRGHLRVAPARYPYLDPTKTYEGVILEMRHDPGRWVPLARVVIPGFLNSGYQPVKECTLVKR